MQRLDPNAPASSRHEYVIALAVIGVTSGVGQLLIPGIRADSVLRALPWPLTAAWLVDLTLGASILLLAIMWRDRFSSLLIERSAMLFLAAGTIVYGVCLVGTGNGTAFFAAITYLLWGAFSMLRARRLHRYVKSRRNMPRP